MPEDVVECECFMIIFLDSLIDYENKYYLPVYLDENIYRILDKEIINYLDDNIFNFDDKN